MKGKIIIAVVAAIALIGCIALMCLNTSLEKQISKLQKTEGDFEIVAIEKMVEGEGMEVKELDGDSASYTEIETAIKETDLRFIRSEEGMDVDGVLYTIYLNEKQDDIVHLSLNDSGEVHISYSNKLYSIKGDSTRLYELARDAFENNCK